MTKLSKCDCCHKIYESTEDYPCPSYKMFVCESYDGDVKDICQNCEKRLHNILNGKEWVEKETAE